MGQRSKNIVILRLSVLFFMPLCRANNLRQTNEVISCYMNNEVPDNHETVISAKAIFHKRNMILLSETGNPKLKNTTAGV